MQTDIIFRCKLIAKILWDNHWDLLFKFMPQGETVSLPILMFSTKETAPHYSKPLTWPFDMWNVILDNMHLHTEKYADELLDIGWDSVIHCIIQTLAFTFLPKWMSFLDVVHSDSDKADNNKQDNILETITYWTLQYIVHSYIPDQ